MIRIYKDNDVKLVTQGVYNSMYKPLGYKPIIEETKPKAVVKEPKVEEPKVVEPKEQDVVKESSKTNKKRRG